MCQCDDTHIKMETNPTGEIFVSNISPTRCNVQHKYWYEVQLYATNNLKNIRGTSVRVFIYLQHSPVFQTFRDSKAKVNCAEIQAKSRITLSCKIDKIRIRCVSFFAFSLWRFRSHSSRLLIFLMNEIPSLIFTSCKKINANLSLRLSEEHIMKTGSWDTYVSTHSQSRS
jgi:hypothetical protein